MGATLDALHRLQNIETQLRSLRRQVETKWRSVDARKRRLAALEKQITETHARIKQAQGEADKLELDRKTHEEHIARLREVLNQARTNKEYAAILTQLNTDKAGALKTEDAVLAALGRVDELKKQEAQYRALFDKERSALAEIEQTAKGLEAKLAAQLTDLETQRETAADGIPPEALMLFERACEKHDGEAMATIEQLHPKRAEYTCNGCNMSITLETINALQSSGDAVRICETCSRILYLEAPSSVAAR